MKRIAVVGGGISGVTAAWQLARERAAGRGVECVLYEAGARLGGTVETERRGGFVMECGPDSWVTEKPWARELAAELGLEDEVIASNDAIRRTYLLWGGRLVALPGAMRMMVPVDLEAIADSPLFSEDARRAYMQEPERAAELKATALPEGRDESVASFVRRHFGDEVTRTVAAPLLAGVFGGDVETLSVRAVMEPFVRLEQQYGSLILALRERATKVKGPKRSVFTTLKSGLGTFVEAMQREIPPQMVRLREPVEAIARVGGRWQVKSSRGAEEFDAVFVATPAHVTRRLLEPLDAEAAELVKLEASSAVVAALAFDAERARGMEIPEGFGYLVPPQTAGEDSLLACTFVNQKFGHRAPEGGVLLRAFFGNRAAGTLMAASDEEVISRAREQMALALGELPQPTHALVRRWPFSLPQYAVGHLDRMRALEERVARLPGLRLLGNAYYGVGLPGLMHEARKAAEEALG